MNPIPKPPKRPPKLPRYIKRKGRKTLKYERWRDKVAIPYLDETFGHYCVDCGVGGKLDVDHQLGRGSHPELRMELSNVVYRCRDCHTKKTDHIVV